MANKVCFSNRIIRKMAEGGRSAQLASPDLPKLMNPKVCDTDPDHLVIFPMSRLVGLIHGSVAKGEVRPPLVRLDAKHGNPMTDVRSLVLLARGSLIRGYQTFSGLRAGDGPTTRWPLAVALALAVASFSQASPGAAMRQSELSAAQQRGLAFAEQRCSACHAVTGNRVSPNPESPPFQDIANRTGVTRSTLRQFLKDSHNYPAAMNFQVEDKQIGDLTDYIMTMHRPGYRPSI
jgi:mono/diheme cytochrome c family protein